MTALPLFFLLLRFCLIRLCLGLTNNNKKSKKNAWLIRISLASCSSLCLLFRRVVASVLCHFAAGQQKQMGNGVTVFLNSHLFAARFFLLLLVLLPPLEVLFHLPLCFTRVCVCGRDFCACFSLFCNQIAASSSSPTSPSLLFFYFDDVGRLRLSDIRKMDSSPRLFYLLLFVWMSYVGL